MAKENAPKFTFNISLSVLNHLGRNLYRSFITVVGEAISNSWDAEAKNVWIYINKEENSLVIKDDGIGMTADDFQNKFLKIGYSKRKNNVSHSIHGRPFIGRKGIGKLALLSCAEKIEVLSKTKRNDYIGGVIDNRGLDDAITEDLTPQQYLLGNIKQKIFEKYTKNHRHGTIIYFENVKGGIKNSLNTLKKVVALYFRFSLIDNSFNIFIDDEKITYDNLKDIIEKTEFLWKINELKDPFINKLLENVKEYRQLKPAINIQGFIASVDTPRSLNIMNMDERVSIDLFVNGRLRERDILKHIPSAKIVEDYLYGQIHYNELDEDQIDRFTSNREGIVGDDAKYQEFLDYVKENIIKVVVADWDPWRRKYKKTGDPENLSITPKDRKSEELFNVVSSDYTPPKGAPNKAKIDKWVEDLSDDARYNFGSYAECFISENLIRRYLRVNNVPLSDEAMDQVKDKRDKEKKSKDKGNVSIEIRKDTTDLSYLDMDQLAHLADNNDKSAPIKNANLSRDAYEYKPMRDGVAHTSLLTNLAKDRLTAVYENIKARINTLFSYTK
jgi:hypothetical protein